MEEAKERSREAKILYDKPLEEFLESFWKVSGKCPFKTAKSPDKNRTKARKDSGTKQNML